MTFTEVKKLPKRKHYKHHTHAPLKDLLGFITDFMETDVKYAKVEFDASEYVNSRSCVSALQNHITRHKISTVKAVTINHDVYLIRTDL